MTLAGNLLRIALSGITNIDVLKDLINQILHVNLSYQVIGELLGNFGGFPYFNRFPDELGRSEYWHLNYNEEEQRATIDFNQEGYKVTENGFWELRQYGLIKWFMINPVVIWNPEKVRYVDGAIDGLQPGTESWATTVSHYTQYDFPFDPCAFFGLYPKFNHCFDDLDNTGVLMDLLKFKEGAGVDGDVGSEEWFRKLQSIYTIPESCKNVMFLGYEQWQGNHYGTAPTSGSSIKSYFVVAFSTWLLWRLLRG